MNIINFLTLRIQTLDFNLVAKQPDLLQKLRQLTLNPLSGLNYELNRMVQDAEHRFVDCKILMAYRLRDLVAWGMLSKESTDFFFSNDTPSFDARRGWLFEVYVGEEHRRKGIASELYKTALHAVHGEMMFVCPWDHKSEAFYRKNSGGNVRQIK